MSWFESSIAFIDEQKLKHPDMSRDELKKLCSKNYPYRARQGSAYKGFLKAMRQRFGYKTRNDKQKDMFNKGS